MNNFALLAAALAAITPGLPAAAAARQPTPAGEAPAAQVNEMVHIRTTLHGHRGPVIVLIPGMSTPGAVWDQTVAALKSGHRLLVVEVKGFDGARTPANEQQGLMDGIVSDLVADLKARNFKQATLVGHSFGGLLSMKLALEHPSLAKSLLIVDALPFFGTLFDPAATVESSKPRAEAMRMMMVANADTMRAMAARGAADGSRAAGMSVDETRRVQIANWSIKADPLVVAQAIYEDFLTDYRQQLSKLSLPVTVLYQATSGGAADGERYRADYSALPQARLVPVADSGHFIQLDRPDIFAAELARLVRP